MNINKAEGKKKKRKGTRCHKLKVEKGKKIRYIEETKQNLK